MPDAPVVHTNVVGNWKITLLRAVRAALITFLALIIPAILTCIAPPYDYKAMKGCIEGVFYHITVYFAPAFAGLLRATYGVAVYHLNDGNGATITK